MKGSPCYPVNLRAFECKPSFSQVYGSLGQPDVVVCPKMAWRQLRIASYAYPLMLLSAFVLTIFIKGFINTDSVKACIYAFLHMHYYLTLAKAV